MNSERVGRAALLFEAVPRLVIGVFALVCVGALWRVLATLALHVPFDPNEGWNAYLGAAAVSGQALYPPASCGFVNNYPPLSFYLVGAIGQLFHDNIIAGRIVSLLSFLAVAAGIFAAVRLMRGDRIAGALAALFFMACLLVGSDYVGMNDPELLAHAIQIAALLVLLQQPKGTVVAAFLFVASLFVKHNLVAMPLALAAWLALDDRNRAVRFAGSGLVFGVLGLIAFRFAYGSDLIAHLLSARSYSFAMLAANAESWLAWGVVPLAIVAALVAPHRSGRFAIFCAIYAGLAVVIGAAFAGGAGVDVNAFFDADIALAIGLGVAFSRFTDVKTRAAIAGGLLLPLAAGLYFASDQDWRDWDFWVHPISDEVAQARTDIAFLEEQRGPALCETLALCYWAGKPRDVDVFNMGQAFATGALSDKALADRIRSRSYGALEFDTLEPFALGAHLRSVLLGAYRIDHQNDEGKFFVPR